jgi:hypothetical protein
MATALQLRRGSTAQHATFTGAVGEVTVDTDKDAIVVHDGVKAGGYPQASEFLLRSELAKIASVSTVAWDFSTDTYDITKMQVINAHRNMRRCVLNDSGVVQYYLSPTDSTKKADGTTALINGTDGQVMVEIPKFYIKFEVSGNLKTWSVSDVLLPGYVVHPAFIKNGVEVNNRYVGAYDACLYDVSAAAYVSGLNLTNNTANVDTANDILSSVSGIYPIVGITRAQTRLLAAKRGAGWRQLDFYLMTAIQLLYFTEYGNFNTQNRISLGNTRHTSWPASSVNQTDSRANVAGLSNGFGNGTGGSAVGTINTANNGDYMSYRGIENWFGNVWNWVDGVNVGANSINFSYWVNNNDTQFADNTATNYTNIGTSFGTSGQFVTNVLSLESSFIPSAGGGTSTTGLTDAYFINPGNRVVLFGGNARSGADAGGFYLASDNASSGASRTMGGRLAY